MDGLEKKEKSDYFCYDAKVLRLAAIYYCVFPLGFFFS